MAMPPTLASAAYDKVKNPGNCQGRKRARTGCKAIDDVLCGGIDFGCISCISGEADTGKRSIFLNAIASHLLGSPTAQVVVIDSVGSFDVLRLYQILSCHSSGPEGQQNQDIGSFGLEKSLERVKLMRVFDFVGLTEAVGELRNELEHQRQDSLSGLPAQKSRLEIPDSEDEDDAMLFGGTEVLSPKESANDREPSHRSSDRQWLLIIDNIAHIMSPLLKNNYVQGHVLLTTFFRSLAKLSQDHDICTILNNNVVAKRAGPNISRTMPISSEPQPQLGTQSVPEQYHFQDHPSIFASTTFRPALGKTFASFIDLHLLLSVLPRTKQDARILYGAQSNHAFQKVKFAHVLEVMTDRWDSRMGRWAAFYVDDNMNLKGMP